MKPKQVPLLNLINGYKYCSCTVSVSYFFTPFRHRFFPPKLYRRWVLIQIHDWSCHTIDQCQIFHAPQVLNDRPVTTLSTLLTIRNKCPKAGRTIRSSNYQNSISHKRTPLRIFSFAFETKTAGSGTQSCEAMSCHLRLMCYGQSCSEPDKIRACLSPSNQQACDFFFLSGSLSVIRLKADNGPNVVLAKRCGHEKGWAKVNKRTKKGRVLNSERKCVFITLNRTRPLCALI